MENKMSGSDYFSGQFAKLALDADELTSAVTIHDS